MIANYRGIGLSDMIDSIKNQRQARFQMHVLEVMEGIIKSAEKDQIYNLKTQLYQFFD